MDQYGSYLYSFALYRVQDETIAQDLVQETLTAALKSKDNFKGRSSEKTWLTGILKHKILDYLRNKYREPVFEETRPETPKDEDIISPKGQWATGSVKWKSNPENLLEQKDFMDVVKTCLIELPDRPAQALSLREIDGYSTKKICKILNITPTNCWVILHRARSLMKKCIEIRWIKSDRLESDDLNP